MTPWLNSLLKNNFPSSSLGNHYHPSFRLLTMIIFKLVLMRQNTSSKKDAASIAFIGGTKKLYVTQDRLTGYEQALQEHKLSLDSHRTFFADEFLEEKGYKFSKQLLNTIQKPMLLSQQIVS